MKAQVEILVIIAFVVVVALAIVYFLNINPYVVAPEPPIYDEPQNLFCGDGLCNNGETCDSCPMDCKCVELKLDAKVTASGNPLIGCFAEIGYSAINTGNAPSKDATLFIESMVPHFNKIRDTKTIDLGTLNPKSQSVTGKVNAAYNCDDDIVVITIKLIDVEGNQAIFEKTLSKG